MFTKVFAEEGAVVATTEPGASLSVEPVVSPLPRLGFWHRVIGRRRRFLINERYQLRVALLGLGLVTLILVPLNLSFYFNIATTPETLAAAPELREYLKAQDQAQFQLVLVASLVFLLGYFVVSILETHRTAGAAFNIARHMEAIENGHYGATLKLRKGDNLHELEAAFNRMAQALTDRTVQEIKELEALANHADNEAASQLRTLGGRKSRLLE